ncbi:MAG: serpin family protein, partial [Armatimonadetes bacterium]|nr:serpin family protein [Armatimonadota bacterium]
MSRLSRSFAGATVGVALLIGLTAVAEQPAGVRQLADGNTAFALDLYGKVRAQKGNVFLSPYSVSSALAMTYAGARGDTAAEMARALRFSLRPADTHQAFHALQGSLAQPDGAAGVQLHIANSIWPRMGRRLEPPFTSLLKTRYGVSVTPLDFARATEAARRTINAWVEERTRQKIKDLIARGVLDGDTVLVLVNAVYFKGSWAGKFDPKATTNEDFAVGGAGRVRVATMHRTGQYGYGRAPGAALLELPYADKRTSMVVLLPDKPNGLAAIERQLTPANLKAWLGALRAHQ